jgi:hypothetical protein
MRVPPTSDAIVIRLTAEGGTAHGPALPCKPLRHSDCCIAPADAADRSCHRAQPLRAIITRLQIAYRLRSPTEPAHRSPTPQHHFSHSCTTTRGFVQSGFYEVALTSTPLQAPPCHATSQNPQDSLKAANMIQAGHWAGGQHGWDVPTRKTCVPGSWRRLRLGLRVVRRHGNLG